MQRRTRFTLVELMTVVAIVMVLAAIAIPNFYNYQLSAKRSELTVNVDGITTAQVSYNAAFDTYHDAGACPTSLIDIMNGSLTKYPKPFEPGPPDCGQWVGFWTPDGHVRGSYLALDQGTYFETVGFIDVDQVNGIYRIDVTGQDGYAPQVPSCMGGGSLPNCF